MTIYSPTCTEGDFPIRDKLLLIPSGDFLKIVRFSDRSLSVLSFARPASSVRGSPGNNQKVTELFRNLFDT